MDNSDKPLIVRFFGHLHTINHHKWLVTAMCIHVGLVRQGLAHDLSKYSPVEFIPGVKYWQGDRSPINAEKHAIGYSAGWLHHKGRNRHHFEYWIDYAPDPGNGLVGMKMPKKYVAEMAIDRICASRNYQKDKYTKRSALEYYLRGRKGMLIHPETQFLLEYLLTMTAEQGEEACCQYMKHVLLKNRNGDYHVRDGKLYLD
ncbi:MAG: DUF5662 family protein [Lachnospiraceae bacterium]|jgi:hypothetical protein